MSLTASAVGLGVELRQAVRRLFRSPGFAALAIGTLTVGIGINAAMFALMDALLFRPPPHIAGPEDVVRVQFRVEGGSGVVPRTHYPNVVDLQASGGFAAVAAYDDASVSIGFGSDAQLANAMLVSGEFFRVLRPTPRLGRLPTGDRTVGEEGWVVISYGFWQRYYGGEPSAIGADLPIDGHVHSVVGVLPSGFPNLGSRARDVWVSLDHVPAVGFVSPEWREDLGVELDRTVRLTINFPPGQRAAGEARAAYERAAAVLGRHPNVERVVLTGRSPFRSGTAASPWTDERGQAELWPPGQQPAYRSMVGAGFFATVGAGSLRGRDFDEGDRAGTPLVVIVNAPLARHLWPSGDALGQCLWLEDTPTCLRVVGVLGGVWKFSALRRDVMAIYVPLAQVRDAPAGALFVRARGDARAFVEQARSSIQSANPELPAAGGVLARDMVAPEFRAWRLGATVFSAFAAVALLITAIGLYGMAAASFALRRMEIAIRLALGARWTHVVAGAVGETVLSVAAGLAAGLVLVIVASRWLGGVLFETSPRDPMVLTQAAFLLLVIAVAAVAVPTARALRTRPANLLRAE